jgi:hypothetical protein
VEIDRIIKEFWDVFDPDGLKTPIRGYQFHIDTGNSVPVCCKTPRYGPHEARVINELVQGLQANGVVEDDDGPWGSMVVLAAKPNQGHKHWTDYVWRLCVSYRKLNTITRPFVFPSQRCDDAVRDIGDARFFITMDLYWGYWQVLCHHLSRSKTAFFSPLGKKRFVRMPMGILNAHSAFCALIERARATWNLDKDVEVEVKSRHVGSMSIVDDLLLHSRTGPALLRYLRVILQTCQDLCITVNLKKCRFFPKKAVFVGIDVTAKGNQPAEDKFQGLDALDAPTSTTGLRHIIGFFGFYAEWIPWYEVEIELWRKILLAAPALEPLAQDSKDYIRRSWTPACAELLTRLKSAIKSQPALQRPNWDRRFYLKTDWSKSGMGAVLCQASPEEPDAITAELQEEDGGKCLFDKTKGNFALRLRPIAFISRRCSGNEVDYHSYTGEAATGDWAMKKLMRYLFGREFTWITDCSGLRTFFEAQDLPTHVHQRWRVNMLRLQFTIVHRPAYMLTDCDTLNRYNGLANELRGDPVTTIPETIVGLNFPIQAPSLPFDVWTPTIVNVNATSSTMLANSIATNRTIWEIDSAFSALPTSLARMGLTNKVSLCFETRSEWTNPVWIEGKPTPDHSYLPFDEWRLAVHNEFVDWLIINVTATWDSPTIHNASEIICHAVEKKATFVLLQTTTRPDALRKIMDLVSNSDLNYGWCTFRRDATQYGACVETDVMFAVLKLRDGIDEVVLPEITPPTSMADYLDNSGPRPNFSEWEYVNDEGKLNTDKIVDYGIPVGGHLKPAVIAWVQDNPSRNPDDKMSWKPIFDVWHPAPSLLKVKHTKWKQFPFVVLDNQHDHYVRGITLSELASCLGISDRQVQLITQGPITDDFSPLADVVPEQLLSNVLRGVISLEDRVPRTNISAPIGGTTEDYEQDQIQALIITPPEMLRSSLAITLPDRPAWMDATQLDPDLVRVIDTLQNPQDGPEVNWSDAIYKKEL